MIYKLKIYLIAAVAIFNIFAITAPALAQTSTMASDIAAQLDAAGKEKGANFGAAQDPRTIAVNIIRMALSFLGTIFVCLVLYAGYLWMTAGGNEEEVTKAKTLLYQAVGGLTIILLAYSITYAVVSLVLGKPIDWGNGVYVTQDPVYFKGPGSY